MSSELTILALYGLICLIIVTFQAVAAMGQVGLPKLAGPRDDMPPITGMAGRLKRTVDNSVVAMVLFAPAILSLAAQDAFTSGTLLAAQIFVVARVLYVPAYISGVPYVRTLIWAAGFLSTAYLYLIAL